MDLGSADRGGFTPAGVLDLIRSPRLPRLELVDFDFTDGWRSEEAGDTIPLDGPAFVQELAALPEAARLRKLPSPGSA